ncbi:MAG: DUF1186 domain-containing protein [Rivularia sp. (in: Bacteria)]|nr:DUF1186 domain-containing protein [Rivularia sp. MS3]
MQLSEIISKLENSNGKLPRQALERAIEEREAITPLLLDVLSNSKNNLEELSNRPDYILHICALYLLAQFRELSAYPLIIDFFSIPGDMPVDTTGELVGGDLARILASVCHGNIEPIKQLIENKKVNAWIRASALDSLIVLVVQGIISREQIIEYYKELYDTLFANEYYVPLVKEKSDYNIWTALVSNSSMLAPVELQRYIERTFNDGLILPFYFEQQDFEELLKVGWETTLNKLRNDILYSLIEDAISGVKSQLFWIFPSKQTRNNLTEIQGFSNSSKKSKSKAKNKKKIQQESRRKNRSKKK